MSSGHRTSAPTSYRDALITGNQVGDQADAGLMTGRMLSRGKGEMTLDSIDAIVYGPQASTRRMERSKQVSNSIS